MSDLRRWIDAAMLYEAIPPAGQARPGRLELFPKTWRQRLIAGGYRLIGHGRYAYVWAKRGDLFVLKVFQHDPAYRDFITLISDHQDNPHFPKIKGRLRRLDDNWQAIRVERLTRIAPHDVCEAMGEYRAAHNVKCRPVMPDTLPTYITQMDQFHREFQQRHPLLAEALDLVFTELCDTGHCGIDIETLGNIRMRGNVAVINDPVFDRGMRT